MGWATGGPPTPSPLFRTMRPNSRRGSLGAPAARPGGSAPPRAQPVMRPPRFWDAPPGRPGAAARALGPLSRLVAAATARRVARPGARVGVPVICAGNAALGGTGKTPTAIALCERLAERGLAPHVVTRGHGGRERGPLTVGPGHDAAAVGDEPLVIARVAPVHVARDRAAGARHAVAAGAGAIVLDDGLQNPDPAKDLSLLVVDAERGFGNGRVMPAGPLREPVAAALARADLVVAIGPPDARAALLAGWRPSRPVVEARLEPSGGAAWRGRRVLAFAGIGRPERFFATLRALGAEVVEAVPLGDHAPIPPALLDRLERRARGLGAGLACTEKDAVRLAPADRGRVSALPVRLAVEDWAPIDAALARIGL